MSTSGPEMDPFESVRQWMIRHGQAVSPRPTVDVSEDARYLRWRLMHEEFAECMEELTGFADRRVTEHARLWKNLEHLAKELADLMVVTIGTAWLFGIDMRPVLSEVMRSNWTKDGTPRGDGKITKGKNYQPPDIRGVLGRQLEE